MQSWIDVRVPPQPPDVLAEVFGDEAVVVQLRTGAYYALDAAATALWTQVWQGGTLGSVLDDATDDEEKRTMLADLVRYLVQEELMPLALPGPELSRGEEDALSYPGIEKFTDMEDLLVLDPIHDIDLDGSGWPTVAEVVHR
jgi:hypothetical protein